MTNKLLCQQLKNIIRSLKDQELEQTLKIYEQISKLRLERACRMVSYKCYEASIVCKGKKANGYGRNEQEAIANCIKNVFEFLMEDEANIALIMQALRKDHTGNLVGSFPNEIQTNSIPKPDTGVHQRHPSRNEKVNSSLALNLSTIHQTGDASFDLKGDIETLSKNIGNISMINNSKLIDNQNVSQLEMDDLILKMMLENPEKAKSFKEQSNNQNPNTSYQNGSSFVPNPKKVSQVPHESRGSEQTKALHETVHPHHQRRGSYSKTQSMQDVVENVQKQLSRNNSFNKENDPNYDNREQKTQQLSRSNSAIGRPSSVEPDLHKHNQHNDGSKQKSKCTCGTEEELARAKLKIESLEKKLKALLEENKMLKLHSVEAREKENTLKSTDATSNASTQLTFYNKSTSEKIENQNDMFSNFEHAESTFENVEKPPANVAGHHGKTVTPHAEYVDKQRSQSVDTYSRRKSTSTSYNDVSVEQSSKMDIKKMIPRLRLDLLPNYHLKNQKGAVNPVNPVSNLNIGGTAGLSNTGSNSKHPYLQQISSEMMQTNIGSSFALAHNSLSVGSSYYKSSSKK